jgi:WD40 repeat protein
MAFPPITATNANRVGELVSLGDGSLYGTAWSPDGRWIAAASPKGGWLYDTQANMGVDSEKQPLRRLLPDSTKGMFAVNFSPDGATLTGVDLQKRLYRWSTNTWQLTTRPATLEMATDDIPQDIFYSVDGQTLVLSAYNNGAGGSAYFYDATTLKPTNRISDPRHLSGIHNVEFSSDGTRVLLATFGNRQWLYDMTENPARALRAYNQKDNSYTTFAAGFSADQQIIYVATANTLQVWELNGRATTVRFLSGEQPKAAALAPDRSQVAVVVNGSHSNEVALFHLPDGNEIGRFAVHGKGIVSDVRYSADGKKLFVATPISGLQLYEVASGLPLLNLPYFSLYSNNLAFSPDGKTLATTTYNTVLLWTLPDGRYLGTLDTTTWANGYLAFSPDGKTLAVNTVGATPDKQHTQSILTFFDVETGAEIGHTGRIEAEVTGLRFAADGQSLLAADMSTNIYRWTVPNGDLLERSSYRAGAFIRPIFLADEDRFYYSIDGAKLQIGSLAAKKDVGGFPSSTRFNFIRLSPKDNYVALAQTNQETFIFDSKGKELSRLPMKAPANNLLFSGDESLIIYRLGSNQLQFWDWRAKKMLKTITASSQFNYGTLITNQEGSVIASGTNDSTVIIFGVKP